MLVGFSLVIGMDMLMRTMGAGMFVRVSGYTRRVLMLVRMGVCMLMAMNVFMFVRVNHVPVGMLMAMAM